MGQGLLAAPQPREDVPVLRLAHLGVETEAFKVFTPEECLHLLLVLRLAHLGVETEAFKVFTPEECSHVFREPCICGLRSRPSRRMCSVAARPVRKDVWSPVLQAIASILEKLWQIYLEFLPHLRHGPKIDFARPRMWLTGSCIVDPAHGQLSACPSRFRSNCD